MGYGGLISIGMVVALIWGATAIAKDAPTLYTPDRVQNARYNVEHFDWAKRTFEQLRSSDGKSHYYIGPVYGPADRLLDKSDDFVWMLMPTTKIARHVPVKFKASCPIHGEELKRLDPYCGYNIDPLNHPYKVQCKVGGEWWPTNDYAAGDMTSGDYPDDGNGAHRDGKTYYFLRDYTHMVYAAVVVPSLKSLSQAWLISGDKRYARKGCILLAKVAFEYPNQRDRKDRLFYADQPNGRDPDYPGKVGGMVTDLIWETFCLETLADAYDGLYNAMDDPELIAYLKGKGMPINSGDDLRHYIENYILRSGIEGLLTGYIQGNPGHHQAAAAAVALVLDDYDQRPDNPFNSTAAVDYIRRYNHAGVVHDSDIMVNGLERDGGGEESPGYCPIKLDFTRVDDLLEMIRTRQPKRFPVDQYPPIFRGPKAPRLFDFFLDLTIDGYFIPSIGDAGGIEKPKRYAPQRWSYVPSENYLWAFAKYGNPRFAAACLDLRTGKPAEGKLFDPYPIDQIKAAAARPDAKIEWKTRILDGYGVAILDSGEGENRRALTLNYTNFLGHRQCDPLMIEIFARGLNVLPDLGYPASWQYFHQWDGNSLAHNTVTVDETQPTMQPNAGWLRLFASKNGVHVAAASQNPYSRDRAQLGKPDAKPNDLYERMVVMVDVDETRFYFVDLFAVNGGQQHDQSWHGMIAPMNDPQLIWTPPAPGTLAGKQIKPFATWTDQWGRQRDDFPSYVSQVRTATLDAPAEWTWNSGLSDGADALKLHIIPVDGPLQLLRGVGRSPNRPSDWSLDYMLVRHNVTDGAATRFLSVLDAYQNDHPTVKSVHLESANPLVLKVELEDGTDTIHLQLPPSNGIAPAAQAVGARVVSQRAGKVVRDVQVGQWTTRMRGGVPFAYGRILAVDYEKNRIAIATVRREKPELYAAGTPIRIYNQGRSAMYKIVSAEVENGRMWLTLDATALLAEGKVVSTADGGIIQLDSFLSFADGADAYNRYAGAWLGLQDGPTKAQLPVRGAVRTEEGTTLYLRDPLPAKKLTDYLNQPIRLWQFAPGDSLEIARVINAVP
ncbi:MAG: heparinase II/III family protein [Phycisphaerales bacterium]|jgi:hypothetical protein|nr:heparinase II/III family protein [Phycisphaerales bacterium]